MFCKALLVKAASRSFREAVPRVIIDYKYKGTSL